MFRLCLVLLFVNLVEPCSYGSEMTNFDTLANQVIAFDNDLYNICQKFTSFSAREVLAENAYKLEANLYNFEGGSYTVKVKHRAVLIIAHKEQRSECDLTYGAVVIVPRFVNTHAATWTIKNGIFVVAFPYKHRFDEFTSSCNIDIDTTTINVRRGFPNEKWFD